MEQLSLEDRLIKYITSHIDKSLILSIEDAVRAGYAKAHKRSSEDLVNINPSRLRAQQRRYFVDDALAGVLSKDNASVLETCPKGEHYIVLCSGNITLSHIELHKDSFARPAKHRLMLSRRNAILEPVNLDFFKPTPPKIDDSLHVVAVVLHPAPTERNQSAPNDILITVPYTDWKGYHLKLSVNYFLQQYENHEGIMPKTDEAWPRLREDLIKKEKSS